MSSHPGSPNAGEDALGAVPPSAVARDEEEGSFRGGGGLTLHYRSWQPSGAARAAIVIAHGVAEHGGRYREVARRLVERGYGVWALDHRGHGRSQGRRVFVESFSTFVADLETFRLLVASKTTAPLVLIGHSMGGAIALAHALDRPGSWRALILSGPAVEPANGAPPALVAVGRLLSRVAPKIGIVQLDGATISRSAAVVAAYEADPLVFRGKLTARLAAELVARAERFRAEVPRLDVPVLWLHGTADTLVAPEGSERLFPLVGSTDKTLRLLDGLYHEVFNEPEGPEVVDGVADWLDERFPPAANSPEAGRTA